VKKLSSLIVCLALIGAVAACGGKKGEDTAVAQAPQAAAGTTYDCADFTMTVASGWQASPENLGMVNVLPAGKISPGLYFKFEGSGNAVGTAEESINTMIANYGGSPMESVTIGGVEFKATTYAYSGMTQTMFVAFRNGTKITITTEGPGARDLPEFKAMISSVQFK
jgi:hypothetical protein